MFLGHTSGDHAYLKQGQDHVPIPVEDAVVVSMGFSEGEVLPLELTEILGTDVGLTQSPYEETVANVVAPTEMLGTDVGLTESPYEEIVITEILPDEALATDLGLTESPYVLAIISDSLAEAAGYVLSFGAGIYRDSIEATPLLSESAGYGITFGGGAHTVV